MKNKFLYLSAGLMLLFHAVSQTQDRSTIPHLARQGTAGQLIVNQKPFLLLSGELGQFQFLRS